MFEIVVAHGIPSAATASIGYAPDFLRKVAKARDMKGTRYLHVIAPCPTGWGCPDRDMVDIAREVVDAGLWYLAEYEGPQTSQTPAGRLKLNRRPAQFASGADEWGSVEHYLRRQARFAALDGEDIARIEAGRDEMWERLERLTTAFS